MRLSQNWLIARLATVYVETLRNIPLLVQCFFWYFGMITPLPGPRQSLSIADMFFLNERGVYLPGLVAEPGLCCCPGPCSSDASAHLRWRDGRASGRLATGQQFPVARTAIGLIVGLPVVAALLTGFPWTWEYPVLKGFNFTGGWSIQPEFAGVADGAIHVHRRLHCRDRSRRHSWP